MKRRNGDHLLSNSVWTIRLPYAATEWCEQQFGQRWSAVDNRQGRWCCFWRGPRAPDPARWEWLFEHEQDAVLFSLKWLK